MKKEKNRKQTALEIFEEEQTIMQVLQDLSDFDELLAKEESKLQREKVLEEDE